MKNQYKILLENKLDAIVGSLPPGKDPALQAFTRQFYGKVPALDLDRQLPAQAAAIAISAYEFFHLRTPDAPKIRVFVPTRREHGWESRHTVVELINDDMPFLVDSLSAELSRQGFALYETIHPIFRAVRGKDGALKQIIEGDKGNKQAKAESLIHFEISSLPENLTAENLIADLQEVLAHIRYAVEDWRTLMKKASEAAAQLKEAPKRFDREEVKEARDFLAWLCDRNFVFLGYQEYDFFDAKGHERLAVVPGSVFGIFRAEKDEETERGLSALPPEVRHFLRVPQLIEITKSTRKSLVHRSVQMDYIGIKRFDAKGQVVGEARFLGLFTSIVYYQSAESIPIIRRKGVRTLERAGYEPMSHDGKALRTILEFMPRDELFQISEDDLFEMAMGILSLESRPGVRLFVRRDAFERFVSCMVFVPRDRYSSGQRERMQAILEKAFGGEMTAFYTQLTDSPLARVQIIIKTAPGEIPQVDVGRIEADIAKMTHLWSDLLLSELVTRHGEQKGERLFRVFSQAFPEAYVGRYEVNDAAADIQKIAEAQASGGLALDLGDRRDGDGQSLHLKIYNPSEEIALSDILPTLENMGCRVIDEHPFFIRLADKSFVPVWIRDFKIRLSGSEALIPGSIKPIFEEAMLRVWRREMDNDRFNALVARAGLHWRQVSVLRAYARYLRQIGFPYSQSAMEQTLGAHPQIAKDLVALFEARFDPAAAGDREAKQNYVLSGLEQRLSQVSNLAEDRIIRRMLDLIRATLRTNYYQRDARGQPKPVLSFKLDSGNVPDLPLPKPHAEIFVSSPRVEGIHLRGGKVARGGLRWSDRPEDFRTEILGLMKAQMVKNAVIVPVGSKGGFIVRQPPTQGGRDAMMEEGIACYTRYLEGLLDITDNIEGGKIVPPPQVVRHDDDDPYLVVAADKGTATFSDIANGVSKAYGFWLDDAFASGGSAGYDHKKMAITARGGWVSVTRHFREMGVDITQQEFTCVGIGDMSGDVFGNGMLLSDKIRMVAAFNHMHIFLDPNPDPKKSLAERKRLFDLPRSTWKDYDASLISKGGGIFERSAKTISLSDDVKLALSIDKSTLTPDELMRAILLAPVDLLWNGGIGTYVKAEDETHERVGDRANNAVRVNGSELRCKVVGEGGNLGCTQKGRIEYARSGGRINTDAIDNSGGVDCSDHEVNIKIAFSPVVASGKLAIKDRDTLLTEMTEEVAGLVLQDNILQTQAITIAELQGKALLESQARLMRILEREKLLDRVIEFLPSEKAMAELRAAGKGLTRPELAVLLAYSKLSLYRDILESSLPDAPYCSVELMRYFPQAMQDRFGDALRSHRLRREIIATVITNSIVNRAGITFVHGLREDTGLSAQDIATSYTAVRDAFGLRQLWTAIEESAGQVSTATQVAMFAAVSRFVEHATLWFLRHQVLPLDIDALMKRYGAGIAAFRKNIDSMWSQAAKKAFDTELARLAEQLVPPPLAQDIAALEMLTSACDVITVTEGSKLPLEVVGRIYFALGARLRLGWLRLTAQRVAAESHWERLAVQSVIGDLYDEQRRLAALAIAALCKDAACETTAEAWAEMYKEEIDRYDRFLTDITATEQWSLSMLLVVLRQVKMLCAA